MNIPAFHIPDWFLWLVLLALWVRLALSIWALWLDHKFEKEKHEMRKKVSDSYLKKRRAGGLNND